MKCPACKTPTLTRTQLEPSLPAHACPVCHGHWIGGETYFRWIEDRKHQPATVSDVDTPLPDSDSRSAKLCPDCGRFLIRRPISIDLPFQIERCGGCAGFWLDENEWETLQSRCLHDDLHRIFSAVWQQSLLRDQRRRQQTTLLSNKIGPTDFAELQRIKKWLTTHPNQSELWAFLSADDI